MVATAGSLWRSADGLGVIVWRWNGPGEMERGAPLSGGVSRNEYPPQLIENLPSFLSFFASFHFCCFLALLSTNQPIRCNRWPPSYPSMWLELFPLIKPSVTPP